jgi:hypothetical protein
METLVAQLHDGIHNRSSKPETKLTVDALNGDTCDGRVVGRRNVLGAVVTSFDEKLDAAITRQFTGSETIYRLQARWRRLGRCDTFLQRSNGA